MIAPGSETELSETLAQASAPLAVRGGATRSGAAAGAEVLSTAGLAGISLYEPGALTLVAGAGTPLGEIEAVLGREGQRLAFEPMDHRALLGTEGAPTIGGVVAGNVSGPRRVAVGAARDFMLGVRFVDGAGRVVKNGGRVMKNVTGYDLVRLMAGSRGRLGVLSEVSLKVLPAPETQGMIVFDGLSVERAVAAMSSALGSAYEVTGAAHDAAAGRTMLRIEGFETQVAYRLGRLAEHLAGFGAAETVADPDAVRDAWREIRDAAPLQGAMGDVWRIHCRPSAAPKLLSRLEAERVLVDWGGGLLWALLPEGTDARARLGTFDGHATRVRGAPRPDVPARPPEAGPVAALTAGLKARFDPRGILNPDLEA